MFLYMASQDGFTFQKEQPYKMSKMIHGSYSLNINEPAHNKTYNLFDQQRLRSACAFVQSDQSLCRLYVPSSAFRLSYPKWLSKRPCHIGWMYRPIFAGNTGLIVGFVRLKLAKQKENKKKQKKTLKTEENTHSFR